MPRLPYKFRKKPVVIEAIEWTGDNFNHVYEFMHGIKDTITNTTDKKIIIHTLEGDMTADLNDWIIKGVNGEFYPCKPDIFAKTYELIK